MYARVLIIYVCFMWHRKTGRLTQRLMKTQVFRHTHTHTHKGRTNAEHKVKLNELGAGSKHRLFRFYYRVSVINIIACVYPPLGNIRLA